jgi:hypothetical protein
MWRYRLADLSLLTAESLVLFALGATLSAIGSGRGEGPSPLTVLAAMLGGFYFVRLLLRFDVALPVYVAVGAAVSLLAVMVLLNLQYDPSAGPLSLAWLHELASDPETFISRDPGKFWGWLIVAGAWLRGVVLAQRGLTYAGALTSYTVGLLVMMVLLLFGQGSEAAGAIDTAALPFFMLGLLTLSLVHLSRAEHHSRDVLGGPWLVTLAGTVGVLAVLSAVIGLFPIDFLNALLAPVGIVLLRILDVVIVIIAVPIALLVIFIVRLITGGRELQLPQLNQVASDTGERVQRQAQQGGPAEFFVVLAKVLFLLALAAAVALALWWVFRRLRRPEAPADETREAIEGEGSLGDDLGALLGGLLGRFRRLGLHADREPALPPEVLAVRRVYVRALRRSAAAGVERPPAATPHEFAPALEATLHTPAAVTLSERFAAARYGLVAPPREELADLERAVAREG